jgi:hypothetical protein
LLIIAWSFMACRLMMRPDRHAVFPHQTFCHLSSPIKRGKTYA